ncbi:hypothetical protein [Bartonella henselae]|uniref:hypothetical protein n=1 Tax=Bartonella henselae TaxID=38323 RepID=UPI000A9BBE5F
MQDPLPHIFCITSSQHEQCLLFYYFKQLCITTAVVVNQFWLYITLSFTLGCAGSLFWSAILVAVPDFANNDHQLDRINCIIQTVRNLGYIGRPLLGGVLYGLSNGQKGLFVFSIMVLYAEPLSPSTILKI